VSSGQDYTIYGFMRAKDIIASSGGGARIHVVVIDSQGTQKDYSMPYPVTVNAATPWTKYSFSFSPTASGKAKVRLELTNATDKAWFDDIRLSRCKKACGASPGIKQPKNM